MYIFHAAEEVRSKCTETIQQYYSEAVDSCQITRIEVLPITLNSIDIMKMCENNPNNDEKSMAGRNALMRTALYANDGFYEV